MKKIVILLILLFTSSYGQNSTVNDTIPKDYVKNIRFNYKQLIIPSILIGYGLIGIRSDQLKTLNTNIQEEVQEDIDKKITIDDFSQWVPATSVYALNAFGVEGRNNLKNRSVIFATSFLIMSGTVLSLKSITKIERPDGSSNNSFPSGHTATAFAGAEFLWQEYKDQSIWYGITGYVIATGTGLFRIYNNKHWLTDVAAGAGIGILSTKIAYWINPYLTRKLFNKEKRMGYILAPSYNGKQFAFTLIKTF